MWPSLVLMTPKPPWCLCQALTESMGFSGPLPRSSGYCEMKPRSFAALPPFISTRSTHMGLPG